MKKFKCFDNNKKHKRASSTITYQPKDSKKDSNSNNKDKPYMNDSPVSSKSTTCDDKERRMIMFYDDAPLVIKKK